MYLKKDEKIHEKYVEDDTILRIQSYGQEALIEPFQCYKAGFNRGKYEGQKEIIKFLEIEKKIHVKADNGEVDRFLSALLPRLKSRISEQR